MLNMCVCVQELTYCQEWSSQVFYGTRLQNISSGRRWRDWLGWGGEWVVGGGYGGPDQIACFGVEQNESFKPARHKNDQGDAYLYHWIDLH